MARPSSRDSGVVQFALVARVAADGEHRAQVGRRAPRPRARAPLPRRRRARPGSPPACRRPAPRQERARLLRLRLQVAAPGGGVDGGLRDQRAQVALLDERAREAAQRRALAPAVRLPAGSRTPPPPAGWRRPPPGARSATRPRPPRTACPSPPRPPRGSRAGRRTPAAARRGGPRRGRGWSRPARARGRPGRRPRAARSSAGRPRSARARSSRSRRRSFMVVAAFSVKVTAAIWSRRATPVRTMDSMRSTSSVVLPVPAPASSTKLVPCSRRARSRASWSTGTKLTRRPAGAAPAARARRSSLNCRRRSSSGVGPQTTL